MSGELNFVNESIIKKIANLMSDRARSAIHEDAEAIVGKLQKEAQDNQKVTQVTIPVKVVLIWDNENKEFEVGAKTEWKETIPHVCEVDIRKWNPNQPDFFDGSQGPQSNNDEEEAAATAGSSEPGTKEQAETVSNALFEKINNSKVTAEDVMDYLAAKYSKTFSLETLEEQAPTVYANFLNDWASYEEKIVKFLADHQETAEPGGKVPQPDNAPISAVAASEEPPAGESKSEDSPDKTVFNRCPVVIPTTPYQCILEDGHTEKHKISDEDKADMKINHPEIFKKFYPEEVSTTDGGNNVSGSTVAEESTEPMPEPSAGDETPEPCGYPHADGVRTCKKPKGHDGQHRYK